MTWRAFTLVIISCFYKLRNFTSKVKCKQYSHQTVGVKEEKRSTGKLTFRDSRRENSQHDEIINVFTYRYKLSYYKFYKTHIFKDAS